MRHLKHPRGSCFWKNGRLCQRPVRELENYLKEKSRVYRRFHREKKQALTCIQGRMIDLSVTVKGKAYDKWTLYLAAGRSITVRSPTTGKAEVDRTYSSVHWNIVHNRSMAVKAEEELFFSSDGPLYGGDFC